MGSVVCLEFVGSLLGVCWRSVVGLSGVSRGSIWGFVMFFWEVIEGLLEVCWGSDRVSQLCDDGGASRVCRGRSGSVGGSFGDLFEVRL